jgi:hypothetical protein
MAKTHNIDGTTVTLVDELPPGISMMIGRVGRLAKKANAGDTNANGSLMTMIAAIVEAVVAPADVDDATIALGMLDSDAFGTALLGLLEAAVSPESAPSAPPSLDGDTSSRPTSDEPTDSTSTPA